MHLDGERCYRAVRSKDERFDGWFIGAVTSTGIYCRPSCPVRTPLRRNMRFFPTAAAAQQAGFRACKRCRPDATPGSPEWDRRSDAVARAMRLIADGVVDRDGVDGLARRLGYSARQVERILRAEVGTGPLALARAQRVRTARTLIESSDLSFAEVCFAAGFSSVRQFNATVREVYDLTPSELRGRSGTTAPLADGSLHLRLPFRGAFSAASLFDHLLAAAIPGVEESGATVGGATSRTYRRTLRLEHGNGVVGLTPFDDHVAAALRLDDLRDLAAAVTRCRWLLDLDADPVAVDEVLVADEHLRGEVAGAPGRRVPRTVDGAEMTLRILLAQQVSTAAVRTHAARLVNGVDERLGVLDGGLTHLFPDAARLLARWEDLVVALPVRRRDTLRSVLECIATGEVALDGSVERDRVRSRLLDIAGIGPWTVEVVAMRALGDPDAFPVTDLVVRRGAERLGLPSSPAALTAHAEQWRPWRSTAVQHLWSVGSKARWP
ncbi:MAG: DNA-3-methyladenine glycosylase 2 family protein [Actinobacteria bacterium]|nr:DNA-3-methyladenine glycosylase 2 family protein [Actinomycetota bacterium]